MKSNMKSKNNSALWNKYETEIKQSFVNEKINFAKNSEFTDNVKTILLKKEYFLESAKAYGTPQYILDEEALIKNAKRFMNAFNSKLKKFNAFYAFKSNDLPYLIKKVKEVGINADVASEFELMLALKLGFDNIIFTAPMKSCSEIKLAIENSDKVVINVDNADELDNIIKEADKQSISIKNPIRLSFRLTDNSVKAKWSKFGLNFEEFKALSKKTLTLKNKNIKWAGIHFHASWNQNSKAYVDNINNIGDYLKSNFTDSELETLEFLDIGGGFLVDGYGSLFSSTVAGGIIKKSVDSMNEIEKQELLNRVYVDKIDDIEKIANEISSAVNIFMKKIKRETLEIRAEPGRFICSNSTHILLKINSIKRGNLIVDGGINLLGGAPFSFDYVPVINLSNPSLTEQKIKIYGSLCDPDDHFGYYCFGKNFKIGDVLIVMNQGSYSYSTTWRWQRPTAAYVAMNLNSKSKRLKLVKKEETFSERYAGCEF